VTLDVALVVQNAVRRDGQGRVMVELAGELLRRGHRVTVYAHRVDEELATRADVDLVPVAPGPQIVDDLVMLARATRRIRRRSHDVACVLGHSALPSCPTVFNAQFSHQGWRASWNSGGRPGWRHRLHAAAASVLERWCVRRANAVIASTSVLAEEIAKDVETFAPIVHVVPNGVDLAEFSPVTPDERLAARRALGLDRDHFVVGFLGDYATPRKGLEPLVAAVGRGSAGERLVVAARGDDDHLRAVAKAAGAHERVVVTGFAPPRQVMAAADVVAAPSLYEPFSLVALEAAACGVPVLVSRCAGAASLLGDAVMQTEPGDVAGIRAALDALQADGSLRDELSRAGREAAARFPWSECAAAAADAVEATVKAPRIGVGRAA